MQCFIIKKKVYKTIVNKFYIIFLKPNAKGKPLIHADSQADVETFRQDTMDIEADGDKYD